MNAMLGAYEKLKVSMPGSVKSLQDKLLADADWGEDKLNESLGKLIEELWADASMKEVFKRRSEFQLNDSAEYYFDDVTRLSAPGYQPTEQDVLRSRVRTTGIVQSEFAIKGLDFAMFDVGGQRNERRKWIHCFDNVDAVVFVAALSEFDQVLFEDENMNRLDEAIDLFGQIVNAKWFKDSAIILFLNKKDLFEKKLEEKVFADYCKKKSDPYDGPNEMKPAAEYTKKLFLAKKKDADKSIYSHITTAIDTSNVKFVFNAVIAIILENNLKASGLAG
jgi:GTPase SAR1 family protein